MSKWYHYYDSIKACDSFWSWLWFDWNFINRFGERDVGSRLFGFVTTNVSREDYERRTAELRKQSGGSK